MTKKRNRPDFGPDEFDADYQAAMKRMAAVAGGLQAEGMDPRLVAGAMLKVACQGLRPVLTGPEIGAWLRTLAGMIEGARDGADIPPIAGSA